MSSPMAAAVIGATMPCAPVFTHGMLPPHPSSAHAQPSIPSVDRVAVSSSLPPFPSRHVRSSKHPIYHPDPLSETPSTHPVS